MASMYQATHLEQVYSLFLAQQVFGIPPSNGSIQIPGRDAVPFLTQSNVDRGVLRSLWSVADPDNVGTLTQIRQFQVLLRLVSMAQAGLLGPQMTVETVKLMIPQYSTQQLPLAVFSSVIIPHQDQLMNAYSNFIVHKQIQTTITPSSSITPVTSNQGGFWSLSQYSSPPLVGNYSSTGGISTGFGQRTTSQGSFGSGSFGHQHQQQQPPPPQPTKQPMTVSISDAFSDLGPPADAPLPSLINETTSETSSSVPPNPTILNDAPTPNNGMGTNYGGMPTNTHGSGGHPTVTTTGGNMSVSDTFGNMPHTAPHQTLSSVGDSSAASTVPVTAAFDALGETQDAPLPSLSQAAPSAVPPQDEFGGFENAVLGASHNAAPTPSPFGHQGGGSIPAYNNVSNKGANDGFGGFETGATTNVQHNVLEESDPFGSLAGNSQDAPLPSLDGSQPPVASQNDGDDDDGFGGFETATQTSNIRNFPAADDADPFGSIAGSHDAPLPSLDGAQPPVASQNENGGEDFGGFETATHTSNSRSFPASGDADPFGSIAGSQNAPLPSLDGTRPPMASQNDTDDDDFGGFESATHTSNDMQVPAAGDADPFGPLAGSHDAPLPSLAGTQPPLVAQNDDDDDFGGFETATVFSNDRSAPAPDESDPFGSIAGSHDAPLPSLDGSQPAVASQHGNDNDFGGFETATLFSNDKSAPAPDESDPFGSIAGSHDAPLPSLDGSQPPVASQNDDDDFGGFETATAVSNGGDAPAADEADPFGPLAGTQDAPLPSLDGTQPPVASQNDDDDDFGGFETATHTSNDKDVDPFGSIGGSQDAPLRSLDGTQPHVAPQNDDDDFGGFESADNPATTNAPGGQQNATYRSSASLAESSAASTIPMSAAFDALGEVQDAPLQSMHQSMKPSPQQETDDFGGFENAVLGASNNAAPMPVSDQDDADFGDFADAAFPVQNDSVAVESDPFGPMAGIQDTPLPSWNGPPQVEQQQTDHFGDFASPSAGNIAQGSDVFGPRNGEQDPSAGDPSDSRNVPASEPESGEHKEDEFGGFADAAATNLNAPNEVIETPFSEEQQQQVDDFGDFEDVSFPNTETEKTDSKVHGETDGFTGDSTSSNPAKSTDDEWGAFGSGIAADNAPSSSNSNEGEFGAFNAPTNPSPVETSDDDEWGEFDSGMSSEPPAKAIEKSNPNDGAFGDFGAPTNPPEETNGDDWGAFDSGVASSAPTTGDSMSNPPTSSSNGADDDWGAFDSVDASTEKAISSPQEPADDDDWGAFDNAEPVTTSTEDLDAFSKEQQTTPADDDFGDFGDFEGAETVGPAAVENEMQGKVRGLSFQLPETLLRKSGMSGEHVDLGECFEVNIGLELDLDVSKKNRFERCIQVLEILTKSDSKLASYWDQLFNVVKDELVYGKGILSKAKELSPDELKPLKKPLKTMVLGFAEYLRVIRSIVGTIGDMLMLDDSALLTIDTWGSSWCSLSILEKPLEIEKLWKELEKESANITLSQEFARANDSSVSLKMIRRRVVDRSPANKLCELTLVPLSKNDKGSTTGVVSWQGRNFMACSANILANRCPFYVIA